MSHSLLFVDDEERLLQTMREFFGYRGFEVDCATELEEALALIEHRRYSLVVCDICLQGVRDAEGLEVVAHVRSFSPETRVVILTGVPAEELVIRASEHRVDRFLAKPHPLPLLASIIENVLDGADGDTHAHAS